MFFQGLHSRPNPTFISNPTFLPKRYMCFYFFNLFESYMYLFSSNSCKFYFPIKIGSPSGTLNLMNSLDLNWHVRIRVVSTANDNWQRFPMFQNLPWVECRLTHFRIWQNRLIQAPILSNNFSTHIWWRSWDFQPNPTVFALHRHH